MLHVNCTKIEVKGGKSVMTFIAQNDSEGRQNKGTGRVR